jgi:hypothetical protein
MSKRSKRDIKLDIHDAIQAALDGEYLDDNGMTFSIGADSDNDFLTVGQVFYDDGTEAEVEIRVKVQNVQKVPA